MNPSITTLYTIISIAALGSGIFCIYKHLHPTQKEHKGYYPVNATITYAENLTMNLQPNQPTAVPKNNNIDILSVQFEFDDVTCNKKIKIKNSVGFKEGMNINLLYNPTTFDLIYEQVEENNISLIDALRNFDIAQIHKGNTLVIGFVLIVASLFSLLVILGRMDIVYLITSILLIANYIYQRKKYQQYQADRMSGMFDTVKATCIEHKMHSTGRNRVIRYKAVYFYVYNGVPQKYTQRKSYNMFNVPPVGSEVPFPLDIRTGKIEEAPNLYTHGKLAVVGIIEMITYFVICAYR